MTVPFTIGLLHNPAQVLAFLSLLTVLGIAATLKFSKTAAQCARIPLTSVAIALALASSYNLSRAPMRHSAQPTTIFFPDPAPPRIAVLRLA